MNSFTLTLTDAGLDALVDAQNSETETITIAEVGVSPQAIIAAPTLTAIPGEVKRINAISGAVISETVIHMTANDATGDVYDVRTFALYLADGTLFAVYSQDDIIVNKASPLRLLFGFNVAFADGIGGDITFGDATFLFPPATETIRGVAELATQGETDAGTDDERIVTPLKLAARLAPVLQSIADEANARANADSAEATARTDADDALNAAISDEATARANAIAGEAQERTDADDALNAALAALIARTVTGTGLATGGGDLSQSREINVLAATAAQIIAGTASDAAITPAGLGPMVKSMGQNGYCTVPTADPANTLLIQWGRANASGDGLTTISYPIVFTGAAFAVVADGTSDSNTGAQDNFPSVRAASIGGSSFQVFSANQDTDTICYIAIGRLDLS